MPNVEFAAYVQNIEIAQRKKQGWSTCDLSLIDAKMIPSAPFNFLTRTIRMKKDSVHIFAGPFDSLWITFGLVYSLLLNNKTYILTEPYSPIAAELLSTTSSSKNWILAKARPWKYRLLWALLRRKVKGVFAISPLAIEQLLLLGVSQEKIFPYAYFVPQCPRLSTKEEKGSGTSSKKHLRLVFVGSLNHRKGLDLAINAITALRKKNANVTLDVFGPGDDIDSYAWSSHICYKGRIPFGAAQSVIATYDVLLLPSRYDGWGVVVNEALLAGVPVLCSDQVGASTLIKKWQCGLTYDCLSEDALAKSISDLYEHKDTRLAEFRSRIKNDVRELLLPESGAKFIIDCIRSHQQGTSAPRNPWYI